jgi:UDP-N-acetylmuramyl pentapeptide synthase
LLSRTANIAGGREKQTFLDVLGSRFHTFVLKAMHRGMVAIWVDSGRRKGYVVSPAGIILRSMTAVTGFLMNEYVSHS